MNWNDKRRQEENKNREKRKKNWFLLRKETKVLLRRWRTFPAKIFFLQKIEKKLFSDFGKKQILISGQHSFHKNQKSLKKIQNLNRYWGQEDQRPFIFSSNTGSHGRDKSGWHSSILIEIRTRFWRSPGSEKMLRSRSKDHLELAILSAEIEENWEK